MFFCSHVSEKVFKIRPRFRKTNVVPIYIHDSNTGMGVQLEL